MNSNLIERSDKFPYPFLVSYDNDRLVVLLCAPQKGTVVHCTTGEYIVGNYRESWDMESYSTFYNAVELFN